MPLSRTLALSALAALSLVAVRPAAAQSLPPGYAVSGPVETLTAPFTSQTGTSTTNLFSNLVEIQVSGTGNALFGNVSDAFYFTASQQETNPNGDFELGIGTPQHPFLGENDGQAGKTDAIKYDIVFISGVGTVASGTIPAYSTANTYDFVINVPNTTPTPLLFGVNDGGYGDNGGAYTIKVSQLAPAAAPEPSQFAAFAIGLIGLGALALKAKRRVA